MHTLDVTMQRASVALGEMDYLTCETLCLQALSDARRVGDWAYYARVLMPLQEARRQRRLMAAEGVLRLGTTDLRPPVADWVNHARTGCFVVTHPHTADDARALLDALRRGRHHVEVLYADNPADATTWRLTAIEGPATTSDYAAPPSAWRDHWLPAGAPEARVRDAGITRTAGDWFLDACEALGDAALARLSPDERADVDALEPLLAVAPDHEILHQTLAFAARQRARRV
jgi:hypothetical protein